MEMLHAMTIIMAAAVLVVSVSKKLGFGTILGYILAGVAIGPWGLDFITDADSILSFSEIGVVLLSFYIFARYLLRPILRFVAEIRTHEIFTATALLLVLGSALIMESIGVSMALGAFFAGVLVADSEYRYQLDSGYWALQRVTSRFVFYGCWYVRQSGTIIC